MDEKKKKEELQSRREFFKRTAKAALPFVVGAVIAANPIVAKAASGCHTCSAACTTTCVKTCSNHCGGGCKFTCSGGCKNYGCKGVNKN